MPKAAAMSASVALRKDATGSVGPDRIALLEAIGVHGSITGAGKAVGLSYRAAWDAVRALNGLSDAPLVRTQVGGRRGGFAEVTAEGRAVIGAFHAAEAEVAQVLAGLERRLAGEEPRWPGPVSSLGMKTSARNVLRGVVETVADRSVDAEVVLDIGDSARIVSQITHRSVDALGLAPGRPAMALIKSSFVSLARRGSAEAAEGGNQIPATVARVERGEAKDEVTLDIGGEKSLTATVARQRSEALNLEPGARVTALVDATQVILAVD